MNHMHGKQNFEEITDFFSLETSGIPERFWDTPIDLKLPYYEDKITSARDLIEVLKKIYCGKISYEFMHMNRIKHIDWIR